MCPPLSDCEEGTSPLALSDARFRRHRALQVPSSLRPLGSGVVSDISDDAMLGLSEFALLPENAEQAGAAGPAARGASRRRGRHQRPEVGARQLRGWCFLHGGGQNAHTWDNRDRGAGRACAGRRPARPWALGLA